MSNGAVANVSEFKGSVLGFIGYNLLVSLVAIFTLGFGLPFILVVYFRWLAKNTYIEGKQLKFVGKGSDLFVKYLLWFLLIIITFGIYGFWVPVKVIRWKVANTMFA